MPGADIWNYNEWNLANEYRLLSGDRTSASNMKDYVGIGLHIQQVRYSALN